MLLSLISMSDEDIETVTTAVRDWCHIRHCEVDSAEGRRALTAAIDLIQASSGPDRFIEQMTHRLGLLESAAHE